MRKSILPIVIVCLALTACNDGAIIENYEIEISELKSSNEVLRKEIEDYETEMMTLKGELTETITLKDDLEVQLGVLKADIKTENDNDMNLKSENETLTNEVNRLKWKNEDLLRVINELHDEIDVNYKGLYIADPIEGRTDVEFNPFIISSSTTGWRTFQGYLFGGYGSGLWYTLDDFSVYEEDGVNKIGLVDGSEEYMFYDIDGLVQAYSGEYPNYSIDYSGGGEFNTFNYDLGDLNERELIIGISGDWDGMPRIPKISNDGKIQIDIDGDGTDEFLAEKKAIENQNILYLISDYGEKEVCSYYDEGRFSFTFADLNGDNKLELITEGGMNWNSLAVYEYRYGNYVYIDSLYIGD